MKDIPDQLSRQIYFSKTSPSEAPSPELMEIVIAGVYDQLEQYQIQYRNNPSFAPVCRKIS
jgi:hypothetical protein